MMMVKTFYKQTYNLTFIFIILLSYAITKAYINTYSKGNPNTSVLLKLQGKLELVLSNNIAMSIDFYYIAGSPPCAMVSLTAAALGIDHKLKPHFKDITANEQLEEDFVKINPQHTAPVIIDDGFTLWESRSICKYLVAKYGNEKHKKLYPEDIKTRALVDQRLDFDLGTLYARFYEYYYWQLIDGSPLSETRFKLVREALGFLNTFLEGNKFAVGSEMTLADLNLAVTILIHQISDVSIKEYPNIVRWFELVKRTAPKFDEIMQKYAKDHNDIVLFYKDLMKRTVLNKNKSS